MLAFLHPRIAGQELVVAHTRERLAVESDQGSGDAHLASARLAGGAAAADANVQVDRVALAGGHQRVEHGPAVFLVRKVFVQAAGR